MADWFDDNSPANERYPQRERREKIRAFYQQYLGRDPFESGDEAGFAGWYDSNLGIGDIERIIKASPEAETYAAQPQAQPPAPGPAAADANRYEAGRAYTPYSGWDVTKLNDLSRRNAKQDFMRAVQTLGTVRSESGRGNLQPIVDWMRARGYPDAKAVGDDKIDFGDGFGPIDVLTSQGTWWWQPTAEAGGGGGAAGGRSGGPGGGGASLADLSGGAGIATGALTAPWTPQFSYAPFEPTAPFGEEFSYADYQAPTWTERFQPPTQEELFADPGIQFELGEGQKAIERSAAARGTLLTGGTLKDLSQYRQGLASTRYGDVYGRRAGEYQQRYGEFADTAGRGLETYRTNLGKALTAYGTRGDVNREQYNRARDVWGANLAKTRSDYDLQRDIFEANQDRPFTKLYSLAQLGRY